MEENIVNINLDWYKTFLVAAEYQNYHKASAELFTTQTTVLNHVKHLETLLQVKLFEKTGQYIKLTAAGKQFYSLAHKTIEVAESGIRIMQNSRSNFKSQLKVSVSPYIASYLIPKFLPSFFEKAPQIDIAVSVEENPELKIADKTYDVGISRRLPTHNKLTYKKICEGTICLIVPNKHENQSFKTESDYFKKYRILCDNHPHYWKDLKQQIFSVEPNAQFMSITSVHATEYMIRSNQGISYLPLYILNQKEDSQVEAFPSVQVNTPVSFTYMMWGTENESIYTFNSLFEEYIKKEQT